MSGTETVTRIDYNGEHIFPIPVHYVLLGHLFFGSWSNVNFFLFKTLFSLQGNDKFLVKHLSRVLQKQQFSNLLC